MRKLLFALLVLFISCKKQRNVTIQGIVTDYFTGEPIEGIQVQLTSTESVGVSGGVSDYYFTHTDSKGEYYFRRISFSGEFIGDVAVYDNENFAYMDELSGSIRKRDAKLVGKTKLTRDLKAVCIGTANVTVDISQNFEWRTCAITGSFTSAGGETRKFGGLTINREGASSTFTGAVLIHGYPDGTTIFQYSIKDKNLNVLKTQDDSFNSSGCGRTTQRHVTIN